MVLEARVPCGTVDSGRGLIARYRTGRTGEAQLATESGEPDDVLVGITQK
jgi:hypothetical protein